MTTDQENAYLKTENFFLKTKIDELEELVRALQRNRFASKSESLNHPGMKSLFHDEAETAEPTFPEKKKVRSYSRSTARKPIPEDLPRENIYLDLPEAEKVCSCCSEPMQQVSEKISEKLHIKPRRLSVHRFIKPVYGCKKCETVKQAKMPAHRLSRPSVTLESLAYLAYSKYAEGLPLYRIEKSLKADNVELGRDKMSRWMIQIAGKLFPIKDLLHQKLLESSMVAMDETSFQVLKEKDRPADRKSYVLVQTREGPPGQKITVFHYEKSRAKATIEKYLDGFSGSFLTDGLGVYQTFSNENSQVSHGGCWAHARRKFADAAKGKKNRVVAAKQMLLLIKDLFKAEKEIVCCDVDGKLEKRAKDCKPIIDKIHDLLAKGLVSYPANSLTGKAFKYLDNQWDYLTRFLEYPHLIIHNNYVERQIKPFVLGRKAWLFADSERGAHVCCL